MNHKIFGVAMVWATPFKRLKTQMVRSKFLFSVGKCVFSLKMAQKSRNSNKFNGDDL
jgi:hypothetical protein